MTHKTFFKQDIIPPRVGKKKLRGYRRKATGEREVFKGVWEDRPHFCAICGAHIRIPRPWCFAHKLPKSTFPEFRLVPRNIELVCSMTCHATVDSYRKSRGFEWAEANREWLNNNKPCDPGDKERNT